MYGVETHNYASLRAFPQTIAFHQPFTGIIQNVIPYQIQFLIISDYSVEIPCLPMKINGMYTGIGFNRTFKPANYRCQILSLRTKLIGIPSVSVFLAKTEDTVNVIWHHDKLIQYNKWI